MTQGPMQYLPPEEGFQDPDRPDAATPDQARAVVIPFGLEASVSYEAGTAKGPAAILAASQQLELFDEELWREPVHEFGIATLSVPHLETQVGPALDQIEQLVECVLSRGRFPLVLGGEHSLTVGAIRPFARRFQKITILQIDAHADLRDGYLGEHYSHAAAMRRALDFDNVSLVGVGIRAISREEASFLNDNQDRVSIYWGKDQENWDLDELARHLSGADIYVTFDVDGLDSCLMPSTGTPVPGGLMYHQALEILRIAADAGQIVGADVVELAPVPGLHAADFTAAALANKILNYALSGTGH